MIVYWRPLFLIPGLVFFGAHVGAQETVPSVTSSVYILPTETQTHSETTIRPTCSSQYVKTPNIFNWENINNCFRDCPPYTTFDFTTPRGRGRAFSGGSTGTLAKPILFENVHEWKVVNCTAISEFTGACGTPGGNSYRGLYSSGGAPTDPDIRPRIGSTFFPGSYATFALKSFKIWTPDLVDNCSDGGCKVHIVGHKEGGDTIAHTEGVSLTEERTSVVGLGSKGFDAPLKAVDVWVTYASIGESVGQPFVIDDISFDEMTEIPRSPSCPSSTSSTSTGLTGTCSPSPTTTTTFTIDFDDFTFQTTTFIGPPGVPTTTGLYAPTPIPESKPYKGLYWDSSFRISTKGEHPDLANVIIPSGSNFVYVAGGGGPRALIKANSYDERFSVKSLYILCKFPEVSSGRPCLVTFYGFRDPYDGSGLPERVSMSLRITDPGTQSNGFTFVDLASRTNSPGAFERLSYFFIVCSVAEDGYRPYMLDSIVFTRQLGEGRTCRVPGSIIGSFPTEDGWVVTDEPLEIPPLTGGLKWGSGWVVTGQSLYTPGSLGYSSSTSPPNALYGIDSDTSIDTYIKPNPPVQLCDLESINLTIDYEQAIADPTLLENVEVEIMVKDSCGQSYDVNVAGFYNIRFTPGGLRYTFERPLKAISAIKIKVFVMGDDGDRTELKFWADDLSFRVSQEELRGCVGCGARGQQWCEYPGLLRVGEYGFRTYV